jgi:hypothetical protein
MRAVTILRARSVASPRRRARLPRPYAAGQRVDERVAFGASGGGAFWVVGLLRVGDLFVEVGKAALVRGTGGVV